MQHESKESPAVRAQDVKIIDVFENLTSTELEGCARTASRRRLVKNESAFHQGGRPVRFHALLSGSMRILQAGPDGELSVIRFIGPGEVFGLFALFTGHGYPADATAVVDSVEVSWSEAQLHELIERHPQIAMSLVAVAARRLADLQERLREVSTQSAERRIANSLLRLSKIRGEVSDERPIEVPMPLTRKDLAALSATTLHTASRIMSAWERRGILNSAGRCITILWPVELARIGQSQ